MLYPTELRGPAQCGTNDLEQLAPHLRPHAVINTIERVAHPCPAPKIGQDGVEDALGRVTLVRETGRLQPGVSFVTLDQALRMKKSGNTLQGGGVAVRHRAQMPPHGVT